MTPPQIAMLKKLIEAERFYWKARLNGEPYVEDRWRMIEVGRFAGVDKRTARSLEDAGLIEGWASDNNQWWVRLRIDDSPDTGGANEGPTADRSPV